MNTAEIKRIIEAVLLCAQQPMPVAELRKLFGDELEIAADTVRALLDELREDWHGRGVELVPLASGWRFRTTPDVARFVERLTPERAPRYSRAVLETLAIVAYRQPVTRGDIEEIRGVSVSAQIVKTLEDRGWIEVIGHKEVVGRPALFATTRQFLDDLGLRSLQELPALDDPLVAAEALGQAAMPLGTAVDAPAADAHAHRPDDVTDPAEAPLEAHRSAQRPVPDGADAAPDDEGDRADPAADAAAARDAGDAEPPGPVEAAPSPDAPSELPASAPADATDVPPARAEASPPSAPVPAPAHSPTPPHASGSAPATPSPRPASDFQPEP